MGEKPFTKRAFTGTADRKRDNVISGRFNASGRARSDKDPTTRVIVTGIRTGELFEGVKRAVRSAAEAATDFSWLSRGDRVFIKPAHNSGNPYPATTSPEAVAVMIELLKEKGAGRIVVGDMAGIEHLKLRPDGLTGSTRQLMERSGMANAALQAGAEIHCFEEPGWNAFYEDLPAPGSHWKKGLMMPDILQDMDHIVLMPRCSRHALAGSTLGLKAAVGYWRTDTRLEYHKDAATFQEKTAEGNTVKTLMEKQRLVLSAAHVIQTTFGPDRGTASHPPTGLVFASRSVTAHDMVSLAWLLENRTRLPESKKRGFNDPYARQWMVSLGNRWVVHMLGGLRQSLFVEKLARNDLDTIWDDRIIRRACGIFEGMPNVELASIDRSVPTELINRLQMMILPP
ncbi:MAG: DUF362 domain-containing protein [Desulfobacterales bacterium]